MPDGEIDTAALLLHGADLEDAFVELVPVRLHRDRLPPPQERDDGFEGLILPFAQVDGIDPERAGVRGEGARTGSEDGPAP
jgi:hypothetical protein